MSFSWYGSVTLSITPFMITRLLNNEWTLNSHQNKFQITICHQMSVLMSMFKPTFGMLLTIYQTLYSESKLWCTLILHLLCCDFHVWMVLSSFCALIDMATVNRVVEYNVNFWTNKNVVWKLYYCPALCSFLQQSPRCGFWKICSSLNAQTEHHHQYQTKCLWTLHNNSWFWFMNPNLFADQYMGNVSQPANSAHFDYSELEASELWDLAFCDHFLWIDFVQDHILCTTGCVRSVENCLRGHDLTTRCLCSLCSTVSRLPWSVRTFQVTAS